MNPDRIDEILTSIDQRAARVGVIGLGYVGLPLAVAAARAGFATIGYDVDPAKPAALNGGRSYIASVSDNELSPLVKAGRFRATAEFEPIALCDIILICVPTPLTRHREPDLSHVESSARAIAPRLRAGQLVILESTTYPGTTRDVLRPILEASGLISGRDFFIGFSPEREDPGNPSFNTVTIPKLVSGDGADALALMRRFYGAVVNDVVPVGSMEVAEAAKITENIFRAVNIALVNELKVVFGAMGIDIWDVIEAAKTKPFGYMPFYPGPGLGGHCVPIDPFYLVWKSKEYGVSTRLIELAGEINLTMPHIVVDVLARALDERFSIALHFSRILVVGLAYKKNVPDIRESPSLKLLSLLLERGAIVNFHDPHIDEIPRTRGYSELCGKRSAPLSFQGVAAYNAVLVATDHDAVDYALIARSAKLVLDTRNVMSRMGFSGGNIVKA